MYTQEEFLDKLRPLLQREGAVYLKSKNVYARRAAAGEVIQTKTGDGLETVNAAGENDFVVRNQTEAGEAYLVPAHKFTQKYVHLRSAGDGWEEYSSQGRIIALELTPERMRLLQLPDSFEFVAPWDDPMMAKAGDFLGCPADFSEVYRIARKEFFETYKPLV